MDKTYNNQNQFKDLLYVRSSHGSVLKEKVSLKILQISKKNMCWGLFLIKLWAFTLLYKYYCVLAIVEYFYTNKIELCFFFVFTSSIESVKKSLTFFFFFSYFYKLLVHFVIKRFCIGQYLTLLLWNMYNKTFFNRTNIDYYTNNWKH